MSVSPDVGKIRERLSGYRKALETDVSSDGPLEVARISEKARFGASKIVMISYGAVVFGVLLLLVMHAYRGGDPDKVFANAMELLKVGVIPVATFVIGHYFNKK